jgi:pimeloyl-ACP methyl ester carboxylesterase
MSREKLAPSHRLDLQRVVLVGHSSGGHLAFWLAARHKLPADSPLHPVAPLRVNGVVSIDGPPDLESIIAFERQVCGAPVAEQLLGGSPAEFPARYRQASAAGLLPIGTRQEMLIGSKLPAQWIDAMKAYATAAKTAGDPITVTTLENAGHFDGLNPQAQVWALSSPALNRSSAQSRTSMEGRSTSAVQTVAPWVFTTPNR